MHFQAPQDKTQGEKLRESEVGAKSCSIAPHSASIEADARPRTVEESKAFSAPKNFGLLFSNRPVDCHLLATQERFSKLKVQSVPSGAPNMGFSVSNGVKVGSSLIIGISRNE